MKRLITSALISAVVLVTAACQIPIPTLWPAPPGPGTANYHEQVIPPYVGAGQTVAVLGDSITYYTTTVDNQKLQAAGFSSSVTGNSGYTYATDKPWLDLYAATKPHVMIVNLGTNDASATFGGNINFTIDLTKQRIDYYRAQFDPAVTCLVFTTTQEHTDAAHWMGSANNDPVVAQQKADGYNAAAKAQNDYLRTLGLPLIDWAAVEYAHPEYVPDEIHTYGSPVGAAALAALNVQAAQNCG